MILPSFCAVLLGLASMVENVSTLPGVTWKIYTKLNPTLPTTNIQSINPEKPLKIFLGGYLQSSNVEEYLLQKDIYLKNEDCTVVIVDWSLYNFFYPAAVYYTRIIGDEIGIELNARFQDWSMKNIHILGHSLGAHMAGFAGKKIIELSGGTKKIGRITGWDPALPLFESSNPNERLDKNDAVFVDVIHTDGNRYGMFQNIGHVDFYPNGGVAVQPNCRNHLANILSVLSGSLKGIFCSHSVGREYFRNSMTNNQIFATECPTWSQFNQGYCDNNQKVVFGEFTPWNARGIYFFNTI